MALQGARLACAQRHCDCLSLRAVNSLAGSSPELPAKPSFARNNLSEEWPNDPVTTASIVAVVVLKSAKREVKLIEESCCLKYGVF